MQDHPCSGNVCRPDSADLHLYPKTSLGKLVSSVSCAEPNRVELDCVHTLLKLLAPLLPTASYTGQTSPLQHPTQQCPCSHHKLTCRSEPDGKFLYMLDGARITLKLIYISPTADHTRHADRSEPDGKFLYVLDGAVTTFSQEDKEAAVPVPPCIRCECKTTAFSGDCETSEKTNL